MTMSRHEFLAKVHRIIRPQVYLEVGVQHGTSLNLARTANRAIGIDPEPLHKEWGNQVIYRETSDDFFARTKGVLIIDFAFIDGMHLAEYALRDFMNIERASHARTVVVFDDVLPRNQQEASRKFNGGDWTGDVWKVADILMQVRRDLTIHLVDTQPTGTMLVYNLNVAKTGILTNKYPFLEDVLTRDLPVPEDVINRWAAVSPEAALTDLQWWFDGE